MPPPLPGHEPLHVLVATPEVRGPVDSFGLLTPTVSTPKEHISVHQDVHPIAYLAVVTSICATLLLLYATKLLYLQLRRSESTTTELKRLWLEAQPTPSMSVECISSVLTSDSKTSPFLLGFLGSPARERGHVASNLIRISSGNMHSKRRTGRPGTDLIRMTVDWIKEPWAMQILMGRLDASSPCRPTSSSDNGGELPMQWPPSPSCFGSPRVSYNDQHSRGNDFGDPSKRFERGYPIPSLDCQTYLQSMSGSGRTYLSDASPISRTIASPSSPSCWTSPDRRKLYRLGTPDVIGTSFAASEFLNEGDAQNLSWFSPFDLGPTPGQSFLENLESSSPMPFRFRLPSPLLPTRKKSGSSKTRSPLRSMIVSQTGTPYTNTSPSDSNISLFGDSRPLENEKMSTYNNLGLGRPSQRCVVYLAVSDFSG